MTVARWQDGATRSPDKASVWRAVEVYRWLSLAYVVVLFVPERDEYRRPGGAVLVVVVMTAWTGYLHLRRAVLGRPVNARILAADLVVACGAVLSTRLVDDPVRIAAGAPTLPTLWVASVVAAWAVAWGWRAGFWSAAVISAVDLVEVWPDVSRTTSESIVQLLLVGIVVGYAVQLYEAGRRDLARAVALEAGARERERLAADIHDSVLQVLAYAQRRGADVGGEAAEIGRLAGEQEARLRALITSGRPAPAVPAGESDVRALLAGMGRREVSVATPTEAVLLPADRAAAVASAVAAALDNVRAHAGAGAQAWVLLEDEPDAVTVTVRDDGPGIAEGRLAAALQEGRLGVALGIRRRIEEAGGRVDILSLPGQGTEIEIRVPRAVTR